MSTLYLSLFCFHDFVLTADKKQVAGLYCNDLERHFSLYLLGNWIDLDET